MADGIDQVDGHCLHSINRGIDVDCTIQTQPPTAKAAEELHNKIQYPKVFRTFEKGNESAGVRIGGGSESHFSGKPHEGLIKCVSHDNNFADTLNLGLEQDTDDSPTASADPRLRLLVPGGWKYFKMNDLESKSSHKLGMTELDDGTKSSWPTVHHSKGKSHGKSGVKRSKYTIKDRNLKLDEMELMKQETKLFVLDYLSTLPKDALRARNGPKTNVVKAKTIHFGERPVLDIKKQKGNLKRSSSDKYDEEVREKFKQMAEPIRRRLSYQIRRDIVNFNKHKLRHTGIRQKERSSLPPELTLRIEQSSKPTPPSPEGMVVNRLEEMSVDIMKDYPQLLDGPMVELLTPLDSGKGLTYDAFASVAKVVFEKQLARFTSSIWTRIALIFYLVKEVVYMGQLNDTQLELLVEYATQFVAENSFDSLKKEGGWSAIELQEDILNANGSLYDPLDDGHSESDGTNTDASTSFDEVDSGPRNKPSSGLADGLSYFYNKWTTYGMAGLAVGIGLAYTYFKSQ